jgi:hypothetical protein
VTKKLDFNSKFVLSGNNYKKRWQHRYRRLFVKCEHT